jgi:hypothetical protein
MKKLLIKFLEPLERAVFNYMVRAGLIKPFIGALIGAGASLLGGAIQGRKAKKATRQAMAGIQGAYDELRDPSDILQQQYGEEGIFDQNLQEQILGREAALIPGYFGLQEQRAGLAGDALEGIRDQAKIGQLADVALLGGLSRGILEDPTLRGLSNLQTQRALEAMQEGREPLDFATRSDIEESALNISNRLGRTLDASTIARATMGSVQEKERRRRLADARADALLGSAFALRQSTKVDPFQFLFGAPSAEEQIASGFFTSPLGTQVTDPGAAINLGMMTDQQRANLLLDKSQIQAQGTAAQGQILGNALGSFGTALGSAIGGMSPAAPVSPGIQSTMPLQMNTLGSLTPASTFTPNYGVFGQYMK